MGADSVKCRECCKMAGNKQRTSRPYVEMVLRRCLILTIKRRGGYFVYHIEEKTRLAWITMKVRKSSRLNIPADWSPTPYPRHGEHSKTRGNLLSCIAVLTSSYAVLLPIALRRRITLISTPYWRLGVKVVLLGPRKSVFLDENNL